MTTTEEKIQPPLGSKEGQELVREENDLSDGRTGKFLSEEQFLKVELALLRLNSFAKEKVIYQWRIKAAEKELEVEQYKLKEATSLIKERVALLKSKLRDTDLQEEKQRLENAALMETIAKEHGLNSKRLGYDPESKEIIL